MSSTVCAITGCPNEAGDFWVDVTISEDGLKDPAGGPVRARLAICEEHHDAASAGALTGLSIVDQSDAKVSDREP